MTLPMHQSVVQWAKLGGRVMNITAPKHVGLRLRLSAHLPASQYSHCRIELSSTLLSGVDCMSFFVLAAGLSTRLQQVDGCGAALSKAGHPHAQSTSKVATAIRLDTGEGGAKASGQQV